MLYCKNCGKELKDGTRFCDRCGQSVRKAKESSQAARHREIEELKTQRLNRKKRLAEKEEKQSKNKLKKRKSRGKFVLIYIVVIILILIVSIMLGNAIMNKSGLNINTNTTTNNAADASSTPVPTREPQSGYAEIVVGSVRCPYPAEFSSNLVSGNEKLNLYDGIGGASMIIAQEAKSGEINDLMVEYISSIKADTSSPKMSTGDDWYSVTATVNGTVYHRKCVVRSSLAVYYDFTYSSSSSSADRYNEIIDRIDSEFK